MNGFSSNITDEELYCLFREAAEHYTPKLNDSEKEGAWESIANSLLPDEPRRNSASLNNKWKKRCIALLMVWLLTGGLAIFRIIQLQDIIQRYAAAPVNNALVLYGSEDVVKLVVHEKQNIIAPVPSCSNNNYAAGAPENITGQDAPKQDTAKQNTPLIATEVDTTAVSISQSQPKQKMLRQPKWSIGLTTGMELSGVKGNTPGHAGLIYGLTIQYRFARRWSVETGILVTPKRYTSNNLRYEGITPYRNNLRDVDAVCRVIDIPLNVRYDLLQRGHGRFFASAGLSTYLMQKEDYTVNYVVNDSLIKRPVDFYNKNRHPFSVANLSLGYEYNRNRFSLQAAPYLKIPLKGIGQGKAELFSSGLQIAVKYSY